MARSFVSVSGAPSSSLPVSPWAYPDRNRYGHPVVVNHITYCSPTEAACAVLLECLVPGFRIECGVNYQVALNQDAKIDFLIENIAIELHQPRCWGSRKHGGDFSSEAEYREFRWKCDKHRSKPAQLVRILDEAKIQVMKAYKQRRRQLLDTHPKLHSAGLIVVSTEQEIYRQIFVRFCEPDFLPEADFVTLFCNLRAQVSKYHPQKARRA